MRGYAAPLLTTALGLAAATVGPGGPLEPGNVHYLPGARPDRGSCDVFVSYCEEDNRYFKPLERQLNVLKKQRGMLVHAAPLLPAGTEIEPAVKSALQSAVFAVLLISDEYLDSHAMVIELNNLLDQAEKDHGMVIMTLMLDHCLIDEFPRLQRYQPVNTGGKFLVELAPRERKKICVDLARQIRNELIARGRINVM